MTYANAGDELRRAARSKQGDLCLPWTGHMNMRRFMIERGDYKTEAIGTMNDDHRLS